MVANKIFNDISLYAKDGIKGFDEFAKQVKSVIDKAEKDAHDRLTELKGCTIKHGDNEYLKFIDVNGTNLTFLSVNTETPSISIKRMSTHSLAINSVETTNEEFSSAFDNVLSILKQYKGDKTQESEEKVV